MLTIQGAGFDPYTSKLPKEDDVIYGDFGYLGAPKRPKIKGDEVLSKTEFQINNRPSSLKMANGFHGHNWGKKVEYDKSSVHPKNRVCFPHSQKSDEAMRKWIIVKSKKYEPIPCIICQCQPSDV